MRELEGVEVAPPPPAARRSAPSRAPSSPSCPGWRPPCPRPRVGGPPSRADSCRRGWSRSPAGAGGAACPLPAARRREHRCACAALRPSPDRRARAPSACPAWVSRAARSAAFATKYRTDRGGAQRSTGSPHRPARSGRPWRVEPSVNRPRKRRAAVARGPRRSPREEPTGSAGAHAGRAQNGMSSSVRPPSAPGSIPPPPPPPLPPA